MFTHNVNGNPVENAFSKNSGIKKSSGWHTATIAWQPGRMRFVMDGPGMADADVAAGAVGASGFVGCPCAEERGGVVWNQSSVSGLARSCSSGQPEQPRTAHRARTREPIRMVLAEARRTSPY